MVQLMGNPVQSFDTTDPIEVALSVEYGNIRLIAGSRETTVVDVRPSNESRKADAEAVERTSVHYAARRLEVRGPKFRGLGLFGKPGSIELTIQLPAGSSLQGSGGYGDFDSEGQLGDCSFKTSYGTIRVQAAATLSIQSSGGDVSAGRVTGAAQLTASAGDIRVERAGDRLTARTAYGAVRVAHASAGSLDLTTSYGDVEVGVDEGVATYLELTSKYGAIRNELVPGPEASPAAESLRVRASTGYGEIRIFRA